MSAYERIKHTPGPWFPSRNGDGVVAVHRPESRFPRVNDERSIRYYGGYLVCESMGNIEDRTLACTAPDMYELLRDLHDWFGKSATGPQALQFHERISELFLAQWELSEHGR